jgi:hypothetical protein
MENWNDIIDNRTILAGDFNVHDPLWGSHKRKDSSHITNLIEQHELKICNNFQPTRMGYDNQRPSIIDLTLTASPTVNNWTTLDEDEYYTPSDHKAILWDTPEESEMEAMVNKKKEETNKMRMGWK